MNLRKIEIPGPFLKPFFKKGFVFSLLSFFLLLGNSRSLAQNLVYTQKSDPQNQFQDLYKDVEISRLFPDSKTFADAFPQFLPENILNEYRKEKGLPSFSLKNFVSTHFLIPGSFTSSYSTRTGTSTSEHIRDLWTVLTHPADIGPSDTVVNFGSSIPLPYPYIVPGGRFREIYYWDSYFSCLGLEVDHRVDMIENMVKNFSYLIDQVGHIPNGNRTYYLGRSQPPFFTSMVSLLAEVQGPQILVRYLPEMEKEYQYWMEGEDVLLKNHSKIKSIKNKNIKTNPEQENNLKAYKKVVEISPGVYLNRYCDEWLSPRGESFREDYLAVNGSYSKKKDRERAYQNIRSAAESGWDFSSRWFNGQSKISQLNTIDLLPVDLNSLLYNQELVLAKAFSYEGDSLRTKHYRILAETRKKAILKYLWNDKEGFFLDYNWVSQKSSPVKTLASLFPLYFNLAEPRMASLVAKVVDKSFLKPGGLVTTLNTTGQQWDAPNGWAPLQYISVQGLKNYHQDSLASQIAHRWLRINDKVFKATGKMQEKYNVVDTTLVGGGGEYPNQDGFGWTNGVYQKLNNLYPHP